MLGKGHGLSRAVIFVGMRALAPEVSIAPTAKAEVIDAVTARLKPCLTWHDILTSDS